jgi:hypothetical protein
VAQTIYTHASKCKNAKRKREKKERENLSHTQKEMEG